MRVNLESGATPIRFFSVTESVSSTRKDQAKVPIRVSSVLYLESVDAASSQYG